MDTTMMPGQRGKAPVVLIIGMVLIAGIVVTALLRDRFVYNNQWQVSVTGEGKVAFVPDVAEITLAVNVNNASTAENALEQLNNAMASVVPALVAIGIPEEDIETQSYTLVPNYAGSEFGPSEIAGYNANQQLLVTVHNIGEQAKRVSEVVDTASKNGVNNVLGIVFTAEDVEALKQEARLLALADAQKNAVELAGAADVNLRKIVGWWENMVRVPGQPGFDPYYGHYGYGGEFGGGGPVFTGSPQEVVVQVNVSYLIR